MGDWHSYVEAPKWAEVSEFLYDIAEKYRLKLIVTAHTKGWVRETIHFSIVGSSPSIEQFKNTLRQSVRQYNLPDPANHKSKKGSNT